MNLKNYFLSVKKVYNYKINLYILYKIELYFIKIKLLN